MIGGRGVVAVLVAASVAQGATETGSDEGARVPLEEAIRAFTARTGVSMLVSPGLEGEVVPPEGDLDPREAARAVARQVGGDVWSLGHGSLWMVLARLEVQTDFEEVPPTRALEEISLTIGADFVAGEIPGHAISLEAMGKPYPEVFDQIATEADLLIVRDRFPVHIVTTEEREEHWAAHRLSPETRAALGLGRSPARREARVSLDFEEEPIEDVAAFIAQKTGVPIEVPEEIAGREISVHLDDAPWEDALWAAGSLADADVWDDGKGGVSLRGLPAISMEFQDADLAIVLDLLARNAEFPLDIGDALHQKTVTMNVKNLTWRNALVALARAVPFRLDVNSEGTLRAR